MKQIDIIIKHGTPMKPCGKCSVLLPLIAYRVRRNLDYTNTCKKCLARQNKYYYKKLEKEIIA